MAIINHERVGKAMESLRVGLAPFVSREFINHHKGQTARILQQTLGVPPQDPKKPFHRLRSPHRCQDWLNMRGLRSDSATAASWLVGLKIRAGIRS